MDWIVKTFRGIFLRFITKLASKVPFHQIFIIIPSVEYLKTFMVKSSRIEQNPQKPRHFYPSKLICYTVNILCTEITLIYVNLIICPQHICLIYSFVCIPLLHILKSNIVLYAGLLLPNCIFMNRSKIERSHSKFHKFMHLLLNSCCCSQLQLQQQRSRIKFHRFQIAHMKT